MKTSTLRFSTILSMTDQIVAKMHQLHFATFHLPEASWRPAVNVYVYADRLEVCMDLAGVNKHDIRLEAEPRRLTVSGHRTFPQSDCEGPGCARILVMEIVDGSFSRTLEFSEDIDTERVEALQENGWLWIHLPKAHPGGAA